MTLADQTAMTRQDGRVTDEPAEKPTRPKRRNFTAAYKARILAAYDALPEGSPERGVLLRKEKLYHSHIEHWRKQAREGTLPASTGKVHRSSQAEQLARLRAENARLKADAEKLASRNEILSAELDKTRTALEIAGKAFALLQPESTG
jgi:transposase-like protein